MVEPGGEGVSTVGDSVCVFHSFWAQMRFSEPIFL